MKQEEIGKKIIANAMRFVNLIEIKANAEWRCISDRSKGKELSIELHAAMAKAGWYDGLPYCAAFTRAIWEMTYVQCGAPANVISTVKKLNLGAVSSFNAVKPLITKTPQPGAIFFMQHGNTAHGHAGLVSSSLNASALNTIEGNTGAGRAATVEADRNGDGVFAKTRSFSLAPTAGLHIIGFLNPIEW